MRPTGVGRARGLVSSRKSGDRVRAWRYAPPPELADVIECFWAGQWDLRGQAPHRSELLSDPCCHVVVESGPRGSSGRWVGVWTQRWERTMQDWGKVWGAKLRAGAVQAFCVWPAHTLSDKMVDLSELFADRASGLIQDVAQGVNHEASFEAMGAWLVEQRRPTPEGVTLAIDAVERLGQNSELLSTQAWADAMGLSVRALQRLFREHVGASPKWVLCRVRLQAAAMQIEAGRIENAAQSLTDLALRLGYADHPHFCRDFKRAVGKTPSEFLAQDET